MILETGRIVSLENEGLWVETIRKSACGSCKAEKGCGQSLINKMDGHNAYIWVLLEGRNPANYRQGQEIQIGIPEEVIAQGSLLVYMLPLVSLVLVTSLVHYSVGNELVTSLGGFIGLIFGGLLVRWWSWRHRFDSRVQPVLVDDRQPLYLHPLLQS